MVVEPLGGNVNEYRPTPLGNLYVRARALRDGWPEGGCLTEPACGSCVWCRFSAAVDACDADLATSPTEPAPEQLTLAHPPSPPRAPTEIEQRDGIFDALERYRAKAVALGREAAEAIACENGTVTSTQVIGRLREQGHGPLLDSIDLRALGPVFRKGWKRVGWEPAGSRGRNVAVWKREGNGA